MISLLTTGTLIAKPIQRTSQNNGRQFVTAQLRASAENDSFVISIIAFEKAVCASLLALDRSDAVSVVGPAKPTTWTGKDGSPAVGLSVVAHQLLTPYRLREKRKAVNASSEPYLPARSPLLDAEDSDGAPF